MKGPDVGFPDLIDHEITLKQQIDIEKRLTGKIKYHPLRPSAAGHCSRKLALELEEYRGIAFHKKPILQPNIIRLFDLGHRVESSVINNLLMIGGFEVRYRQQVVSLFNLPSGDLIEGSIDLVLWSDMYKCIADVKSKKDKWSAGFKSGWDELLAKFSKFDSLEKITDCAFYADDLQALIDELDGDFMTDNLLQLNLYANSEFIRQRGIDVATLIYYNKNDSRLFELRFNPSQEVFNETKRKFEAVDKAVTERKVDTLYCDFPLGTLRHSVCDCHKIKSYLTDDPSRLYFDTLPPKSWPREVSRLKSGKKLSGLYNTFVQAKKDSQKAEKAEQAIIEVMQSERIQKVKFEDGTAYEAKFLKTLNKFQLRITK